MRPISDETLAILKGQNLTGQNRFAHSLKLEGAEYYSDIQDVKSVTLKSDIMFLDFAIRSDGKVLVAYVTNTGEVRLSVVESEEILISANNTVPNGTLFTTVIGGPNPISLLRLKNGRILLFVATIGNSVDIPWSIKVYESADGLGDDFLLKATVYNYQRLTSSKWGTLAASVSKTMVMDDGSIIIAVSFPYNDSGSFGNGIKVFKTTDNGLNWTQLYQYAYPSVAWLAGFLGIKSFCYLNKFYWFTVYNNYGAINQYIFHSSDSGNTWSLNLITGWPETAIGSGRYQMDFSRDRLGRVFLLSPVGDLYSAVPTSLSFAFLNSPANWSKIMTGLPYYSWNHAFLLVSDKGNIHYLSRQVNGISDVGMKRTEYSADLKAQSITINKGRGGANTAAISASNRDGNLNPKNPDNPLYGILETNKQVVIKQGYGEDLIETFTGLIDGFEMSTWPQITQISLRDNLKRALDQTITYGNQHTVEFELQPIENIVGYLCYLAGLEVGDVEPTGIQVSKTFSWESYADCFQFLGDLASFEWGCDEYGKFYFRRDYQPDDMFVAYTFEEGADITALNYSIKDDDLYYKVAVFGKSGDTVISYEAPFLDAAAYNLPQQKILKIDATEATTTGELRKIAERAIALMQSRTAVVKFTAIAVPWLQVGDFIGVYERSTGASSIYRISSLSLDMTSDSFTMSVDAYYYGDSIVPGELPTNTATQTVAPATNIIPEMTSNTAPSGVARSSSVYSSSYEPWQAFNSTDADNYWNAITNNGWIEYQFPEKMIVDKYTVKARQALAYNDAMPKDWTFEGFDGEKWIVLDTRTNQSAWGISEVRTYKFANTVAYSKYRLNVTRNNGYIRLQLEQLGMYYGGGA